MALLVSTAYAPPISYMAMLYQHREHGVHIEAWEHIVKQSWRNRCDICTDRGVQSLSIPIERPKGSKTLIQDIRLSKHSSWQAHHEQALRTNYGASPYFEFYWDDFTSLYHRDYKFLWDFNLDCLQRFLNLIEIDIEIRETANFVPIDNTTYQDYRYTLHPRTLNRERLGHVPSYYQAFGRKQDFIPNLSIYDLLMNMGPESLIYLRDYPL